MLQGPLSKSTDFNKSKKKQQQQQQLFRKVIQSAG